MKSGWKDIASAPKDGTMALLFGYHPLRGYGEIVIGSWDALYQGIWGWYDADGHSFIASHWMKLPQLPSNSFLK